MAANAMVMKKRIKIGYLNKDTPKACTFVLLLNKSRWCFSWFIHFLICSQTKKHKSVIKNGHFIIEIYRKTLGIVCGLGRILTARKESYDTFRG